MFESLHVIDCGPTDASMGHNYWEAEGLADECARRGIALRILCHKSGSSLAFGGAEIVPCLPLSRYVAVSNDPVWAYAENFIVHNRAFQSGLESVDRESFGSGPVAMLNVTEAQFLGAMRWLSGFDPAERPKTLIVLEPVSDWSEKSPSLANYKVIWESAPEEVKADIVLGVRHPAVAERYRHVFGMAPVVLPQPFRFPPAAETPAGASAASAGRPEQCPKPGKAAARAVGTGRSPPMSDLPRKPP